jgi:DNA gyrase subunit A
VGDWLGIGLIQQVVVDTMAAIGATPDRPFTKSKRIIDEVHARHGISPRYGFEAMVELAASWLIPLPLVESHGNFGSADFGPAEPRYNEARLSRAGLLAVSSEDGPRLPLGLINGDVHVEGTRPAFAPHDIIDAVSLAAREPRCSDDDLIAYIGSPVAVTGAAIAGDLAALREGEPARIRYSAKITIESGPPPCLVISNLPPSIGVFEAIEAIEPAGKAEAHRSAPRPGDSRSDSPIVAVLDVSTGDETRVLVRLQPDADPNAVARLLHDTWPISIEHDLQLPAPLAALVRACVDPDRSSQLIALGELRRCC